MEALQGSSAAYAPLPRVLGLWQLTAIGIGGLIGVGVFVLTGVVAATQAGPAVIISFLIAGIASGAAALCYAEFSGMIPISGSAYTYSYAVLGELPAWIVGWDLLLEYTLVVAVVAIGWSGYVRALLDAADVHLPAWAATVQAGHVGESIDIVAAIISLLVAAMLTVRTAWGARFNTAIVTIKLLAVLLVIGVGAFFVDPHNWHPFMPFGMNGVVSGAAVVFFAVFGFDTLTTAAEEAKHPRRDLPRAVVLSLAVALALYCGMSLVLTGMVPFALLNTPAPVAYAFQRAGQPTMMMVISVAAIAGITSVLFAFMLAAARIWFAMARDGLLPQWFAHLHPKFETPYRPTLILGAGSAIAAGTLPIGEVAELVNIGTLTAFAIVCVSIPILRWRDATVERTFKVPAASVVVPIGVMSSILLISSLPAITCYRFLVWMVIGLAIYGFYGISHSRLRQTCGPRPHSRP
jgi:APA family basic amino acid/polyamine antiporter